MFARLSVGLVFVGLFAGPTHAQQFDRRARDEPEVVVEHGGRTGTCDVLRFTTDGNFLLAAGDDKVVRVWPHTDAGLDTAPGKSRTLHWRSWRDQLGGIKAMAISPDGTRVAVGGYGLRVSTVAILDRDTGNTLAITWPRTIEGGRNLDAVMAIGFHPDGKRIGFGTADGSLWIWTPEKLAKEEADKRTWSAPKLVGRFEPNADGPYNFPRGIHFPDANTLVSVSLMGQVLACDLSSDKLTDDPTQAPPTAKTLFNVNTGVKLQFPVNDVEWSADGKWMAIATKGNLVLLRSTDGKTVVPLELPGEHYPRSLAIDAKGARVAIGVATVLPGEEGQPRFYAEGNDTIRVYENATGAVVPAPKTIRHSGRVEALAFHPTLNRLAVAGGDADEVALLDLDKPEKALSAVHGVGRRLYAVNLSVDGDVVGVRTGRNAESLDPNDRGAGPWVRFNLPRFTHTADVDVKWAGVRTEADGWTIKPDKQSRFVWHARRAKGNGEESIRLGLDSNLDQAPTCYTFLPPVEGKPARVLVGHYYGCSLFELDPARVAKNPDTGIVELPRAKLYVGHGAEVTSVVADSRGEWFVTAAGDQTVAGWSLTDWKAQRALGAGFQVQNGQLVVGPVDVGSPAWEAGLTTGDVIDRLAVDAKVVYDARTGKPLVGTAQLAARLLQNPQSGIELVFNWSAGKDRRASLTRLKQRPMWKWFPAFDDRGRLADSVMWMWHGSYYYTASLHGDRLVGWHINHPDVAGTAAFHSLERYKHLFLKPAAIARLISTRSVEAALKEAVGENPLRQSFRDREPAPVEMAVKQAVVRPEGVTVAIAVTPQGNNPDLIPDRVELWLNDYRFEVWKGQDARAVEVTIPASKFRAGDNQLTLLATNPARGRAEAMRFVSNPASASRPDLHGLSIGINDYSAHKLAVAPTRDKPYESLVTARDDATGVAKTFGDYIGTYFPTGGVDTLLDAKASRKSLTAALAALQVKQASGKIKPDDLLVVFLAGHGDLLTDDGKARLDARKLGRGLAADNGRFVFCCPDYAFANPAGTALAGEELFEALAGINCRKLVLLDACHAGGAVETNLLRRCIPNGQGPVVFAACDQSEVAFEDDAKLGHGMFTYALLEALSPDKKFRAADSNSDGTLTPEELFAYVSERVPEMVKRFRPGNTQNPICFPHPSALPRIAVVKQ